MRLALLLLASAALTGCGSSPKPAGPALVKTAGRVLSGDKPAAGALLVFHAAGATGELPARARAGEDGRFVVTSGEVGDGLAAGDYAVTVSWRSGLGENGDDGRSLAHDRYGSPSTTPLKASVRPDPDGTCTLPTYHLKP